MRRFRLQLGAVLVTAVGGAMLVAPPASTAAPPGPSGAQRTETPVHSLDPADGVTISYVRLHAPLPDSAGPHPEACDYISYLRYRNADGPANSADADSVVTSQPGMVGGAMSQDELGRQTVRKAAADGRDVEFWSISRRSNCLMDRTGLDAAVRAKNYRVAIDYYYNNKEIGGQRFQGFPKKPQTNFLKHVDQPQTLDDWRTIVTEAIPDPRQRREKVFCGGHSWGGLNTGLLAGWDFDGDRRTTEDAGYNMCNGFFALDTLVTTDPAGLAKLPGFGDFVGAIAGFVSESANIGAEMFPATDFGLLLTPETFNLLSIAGLAAYFEPERESALLREIPHNPNTDLLFKLLLSRSYAQFVTGVPDVRGFRYTNEALLGALMDNNSQPLAGLQVGLGSFGGGPVRDKTFPAPKEVAKIPVIGKLIANLALPGGHGVAPTDPDALYTWRGHDEQPGLDADGKAYTSKDKEVTDIHSFARTLFEGPATYMEPFFPFRLLPDNAYLANNTWGKYRKLMYPRAAMNKPRTTIFGGDGLVKDALEMIDPIAGVLNPAEPLVPEDTVVVPGYRHIDVVGAAERQNSGEPEQVSRTLADFTGRHGGGR